MQALGSGSLLSARSPECSLFAAPAFPSARGAGRSTSGMVPSAATCGSSPLAPTFLARAGKQRAERPSRLNRLSAKAAASPPSPWKKKDSRLVLEDGSVLWGTAFGAPGTQLGEVSVGVGEVE